MTRAQTENGDGAGSDNGEGAWPQCSAHSFTSSKDQVGILVEPAAAQRQQ